MKDLRLNENFEIVIDHRKDLAMVDGREEFEQHIALGLTSFFSDEIGSVDHQSAKSRLRLHASRLVNQSGRVGEVAAITVEESEDQPNALEVNITYSGGQTFAVIVD